MKRKTNIKKTIKKARQKRQKIGKDRCNAWNRATGGD